eukprot:GILK01008680.1.p1 GENE.GILK01008680.1~~GILK01008680.1.p1  ORF type:complete len:404 (-),score=61.85 GILK01008680.1:240-1406(-)
MAAAKSSLFLSVASPPFSGTASPVPHDSNPTPSSTPSHQDVHYRDSRHPIFHLTPFANQPTAEHTHANDLSDTPVSREKRDGHFYFDQESTAIPKQDSLALVQSSSRNSIFSKTSLIKSPSSSPTHQLSRSPSPSPRSKLTESTNRFNSEVIDVALAKTYCSDRQALSPANRPGAWSQQVNKAVGGFVSKDNKPLLPESGLTDPKLRSFRQKVEESPVFATRIKSVDENTIGGSGYEYGPSLLYDSADLSIVPVPDGDIYTNQWDSSRADGPMESNSHAAVDLEKAKHDLAQRAAELKRVHTDSKKAGAGAVSILAPTFRRGNTSVGATLNNKHKQNLTVNKLIESLKAKRKSQILGQSSVSGSDLFALVALTAAQTAQTSGAVTTRT